MLASAKKASGDIVPGFRVFIATGVFIFHVPEIEKTTKYCLIWVKNMMTLFSIQVKQQNIV